MALLRSIIFTPIFYIGSLFFVVAALISSPFSHEMLKRLARGWGIYHRACCRILLGQKIRIIGDMPDGPYLYCFKHESAFETIEQHGRELIHKGYAELDTSDDEAVVTLEYEAGAATAALTSTSLTNSDSAEKAPGPGKKKDK